MTYDPSLGYDDAMPDAQESWITGLDVDEWLELMCKYAEYCVKTKVEDINPKGSELWLWDYFAEHVYPDLGAMDADALYEQMRDAQIEDVK